MMTSANRTKNRDLTPQSAQFWQTTGALLVCVGPSPSSARVVRAAKRMADALGCPWMAVHVEHSHESGEDHLRSADILKYAENQGAEIVAISGEDISESIIEYAKYHGVSKIMIGKTGRGRISQSFRSSLVDRLIRQSGDIDVFVVKGEGDMESSKEKRMLPRLTFNRISGTAIVLIVCTIVSILFQFLGLADANIVMVFLSGVVFTAGKYGRWPGVAVSVGSVFIFDVLFVEPYFTLSVHDTQYFIMFGVMLVIALLISDLTARIKRQADIAERHERRTEILYSLSRHLAAASGIDALVETVSKQLSSIFNAEVAVFLPDSQGKLTAHDFGNVPFVQESREMEAASWVYAHNQPAGYGIDTGHDVSGLYIPLRGADNVRGVLGLLSREGEIFSHERKQMLESSVTQISVALEREHLAEESRKALLQVEAEQWRNALLSSVSHNLRTPLAGIAGTASVLLEVGENEKPEYRQLLENISTEANRLSRLVENLLSMVRIESGRASLKKEWLPVEEVIGSTLQAMRHQLAGRVLKTHLSGELPLVYIDGVLVEQAIINLLENAAKYTPKERLIEVSARVNGDDIVIEVQDDGNGISPDEMPRLFDKFFSGGHKTAGSGLGLTIVKAIVEAHDGHVEAENAVNGGALFRIIMPIGGQPPVFDETGNDSPEMTGQ